MYLSVNLTKTSIIAVSIFAFRTAGQKRDIGHTPFKDRVLLLWGLLIPLRWAFLFWLWLVWLQTQVESVYGSSDHLRRGTIGSGW
jgi:hypothetical protein